MMPNRSVLCTDKLCEYNSGNGVCKNPVYSGSSAYGVTLMNECIFRSPPKVSEIKMDAHRLELLNELVKLAREEAAKND